MQAGSIVDVPLPAGHTAFAYIYEGSDGAAEVGGQTLNSGVIAVLTAGDSVRLVSHEDTRLILVAGKPLREPVAKYGPFVMNTEGELRQAFLDFQAGRF
jgi:hypothetical protein